MLQVTELILTKASKGSLPNLIAFVDMCFNGALFVRSIKLIRVEGREILAFPTRERKRPCSRCSRMVSVKHLYCYKCGEVLPKVEESANRDIYIDMVHPTDSQVRLRLLTMVLKALHGDVVYDGGFKVNVRRDS